MLYKDAANKKSNQKNLGTIKSSNLCTEIIEYSDPNETAVCNLASIGLSSFVREDKTFDYKKLHEVSKIVTENLNKIIDINYYPTDKTNTSNIRHRPIGIGVQGLADTFALMDLPFHSEEACQVNTAIFETIYHGALEMSNELAITRRQYMETVYNSCYHSISALSPGVIPYKNSNNNILTEKEWEALIPLKEELVNLDKQHMGAYSSFSGSPISKGIFQFEMWKMPTQYSFNYDWDKLRKSIKLHGIRNSLLLAPMPTASTSQILGNNECFEPFTSNIYSRRTLAGEFMVVNKYLQRELIGLHLWNDDLKNKIIANRGSVQGIPEIPEQIQKKYKIVWEIPMKHLIDMSCSRGAFICQSQSLNLWMEDPTYKSLTSMHFYGWEKGLKTGIYYLRRKAKHQAQQFTIEPTKRQESATTTATTSTATTTTATNMMMMSSQEEVCDVCSA